MAGDLAILEKLNQLVEKTVNANQEFQEGIETLSKVKSELLKEMDGLETKHKQLNAQIQGQIDDLRTEVQAADQGLGTTIHAEINKQSAAINKLLTEKYQPKGAYQKAGDYLTASGGTVKQLTVDGGPGIGNGWEQAITLAPSKVLAFQTAAGIRFLIGGANNGKLSFYSMAKASGTGDKTVSLTIEADGKIRTTQPISSSSSIQYKQNINALAEDQARCALSQLRPVQYTFIDDISQELELGFIAEEAPEAVTTSDGRGIVFNRIVAVLTKVVQNQTKLIEELQSKVAQLEDAAPAVGR